MLRTGLVLAVMCGVACAAPRAADEAHSVQKRQATTVTFTSKYEDLREVFVNIVVAFAFATVAVLVVLPLLGYKIDIVVAAAEELIAPPPPPSATGAEGAYSAPAQEYGAPETGYAAPAAPAYSGYARSLSNGFADLGARVISSIDVVETALTFAKAEDEACKFKAVCLAERAAINNPFSSLAINTINKSLSGLYKYREAVEAGLRGDDCDLLYDQCNQHIGFF